MSSQHLSDEAVAAFADGYLRGHARERATRHVEACAECHTAVRVQREAAWALRTAALPAPPTDLMARLRSVPHTTALTQPPTVIAPDGSAMLATFAPMAGFVASPPSQQAQRAPRVTGGRMLSRAKPYAVTAAAVALAGSLVAGSAASDAAGPQRGSGSTVRPASGPTGGPAGPADPVFVRARP